ncbi:MAG: TRAP transporter small permease, partial [Pseudomonadota bacterium]
FDPPIPATLKPMVLFVVAMVAIQSVINLISDWNAEPELRSAAEIDRDELDTLKRAAGSE